VFFFLPSANCGGDSKGWFVYKLCVASSTLFVLFLTSFLLFCSLCLAAEAPRKFETKPLPEAGSQVNVTILDGPGAGGFSARVLSVTPSEIVLKRADGTKTRINVASLRSGRIIMT
jgi:hypothetical protein